MQVGLGGGEGEKMKKEKGKQEDRDPEGNRDRERASHLPDLAHMAGLLNSFIVMSSPAWLDNAQLSQGHILQSHPIPDPQLLLYRSGERQRDPSSY